MRRAKPKVEPRIIEQEVIQQPAPFEHLVIEPEIQQPAQVNAEPVYHAKPGLLARLQLQEAEKKKSSCFFSCSCYSCFASRNFVLPQASLNIYAHSQPLSRDLEISLSKDFKVADIKTIAGPCSNC